MSAIYVIVAKNDKPMTMSDGHVFSDDGGELVFEQYTANASLEKAKEKISGLGGRYGDCRIATLVFVDDSAPLETIEARYQDLLNKLGVQGHDGAIAEIAALRKGCGLGG